MKRGSISRKLQSLVFVSVGLGLLAALVLLLYQETYSYIQQKHEYLFSVAKVLASASASSVATEDREGAAAAIKAIGRLDRVLHARIETSRGLLADFGFAVQLESDSAIRSAGQTPPLWALLSSRTMEVTVPVVHGGEYVGSLSVVGDTSDLYQQLFDTLKWVMLAGAIAVAVGLIVAGRLQRSITLPLRGVLHAISEIRQQRAFSHRVGVVSDGETGALVDSFNAMLCEIADRDERITLHLHSLEREVADRTEDFRRARDEAERANAAKSDFLATMSHEIRTPMNGIMVMAELLARSALPPREQRFANVIANSGHSLLSIINDVLDLSKIEAGKIELEALELDPAQLVDETMCLFAERARAKGLDLAAYVSPTVPKFIRGDPVRINQVLGNLVNNALKFTETGHVLVSVTLDHHPERLRVSVADSGIGIRQESLEAVFGAFSQADQSTTRRYGGTGLGLPISKRLVQAMGGELTVSSEEGQGSNFSFTVAIAGDALARDWPRFVASNQPRKACVLLEGPASRTALSRYLVDTGFEVTVEGAEPTLDLSEFELCVTEASRAFTVSTGRNVVLLSDLGQSQPAKELGENAILIDKPVQYTQVKSVLRDVASGRRPAISSEEHFPLKQDKPPIFNKARVLVADDSAVNREVALEALSGLGIEAEAVENGLQALAAVQHGHYDAVLMDGSMPEMDGFEACRQIREHEKRAGIGRTPVLAFTAHVIGIPANEWREAGMDGIITKPFTMRTLADGLSAVLKKFPVVTAGGLQRKQDAEGSKGLLGSTEAETPLLDRNVVVELRSLATSGRPGFVERVCSLYIEHAPKALTALLDSISSGDALAIGRAAHALKSMSFNLGARRIILHAGEIEKLARSHIDVSKEAAATLATDLELTLEAVHRLMSDIGAPEIEDKAVVLSDGLQQFQGEEREIAVQLSTAIEKGELYNLYQPIVDRHERTIGVETLVRWRTPTGSIPPGVFIPIAEKAGLIVRLGERVLMQACRDAIEWPGLLLAVNVSPVQLQRAEFASEVIRSLGITNFPARRLELEITETAVVENEKTARRAIAALREAGVKFSLDDFGTGFSSLTHLRQLPIDKIKIDRSFISSVESNIESAAIVHAVISVGRALGKKIVAEGVETGGQARFVSAAGVHGLQGYYFAKPMTADAVTLRLAAEAIRTGT